MRCRHSDGKGNITLSVILFRAGLLLYISAVAYLCFANFNKLPEVQKTILGIPTDKIVHFCMFFPIPVLGFLAYDKNTRTPRQALLAAIYVCSFSCIFAGVTEIVQGHIPYRSEDITDFAADCLAICLSTLIVLVIDLCKMRRNR